MGSVTREAEMQEKCRPPSWRSEVDGGLLFPLETKRHFKIHLLGRVTFSHDRGGKEGNSSGILKIFTFLLLHTMGLGASKSIVRSDCVFSPIKEAACRIHGNEESISLVSTCDK